MAGDAQAAPVPSESATLADVIASAAFYPGLGTEGLIFSYHDDHLPMDADSYLPNLAPDLARAVLASTWLADHDKRVRDEALAGVDDDLNDAGLTREVEFVLRSWFVSADFDISALAVSDLTYDLLSVVRREVRNLTAARTGAPDA